MALPMSPGRVRRKASTISRKNKKAVLAEPQRKEFAPLFAVFWGCLGLEGAYLGLDAAYLGLEPLYLGLEGAYLGLDAAY
ncbi:hypothetical protein, partial [Indiicoccus explosivorum]|uniref:hypothetical protein n=1 Tax=Indiicoccus explosivorum TaxID=1917864 RepID=UPI0019D3D357